MSLPNQVLHPIFVLDGPDGSGKSTLAKELCEQLGAKYLHLTYRWGSKMHLYHTAALYYILREATKRPVVLDRWWMSELVYANVYRGGSKWPLLYRMFEKAAIRHSITYVMCRPIDRGAYVDHFHKLRSERDEMYFDNMEKVYDGYRDIEHKLKEQEHPHLMTYDWMTMGHDVTAVARSIYEFAYDNRAENYQMNLIPYDFYNITGSFVYAKHLLVGDELRPKTRREVWPFFDYGNSSLYLAKTLEELNIPEHDLMHINANHRFMNITNSYLKKAEEQKLNIIAMGTKAYEHLVSLGIHADHVIKHPQYYARFSRVQGHKDIKEALK